MKSDKELVRSLKQIRSEMDSILNNLENGTKNEPPSDFLTLAREMGIPQDDSKTLYRLLNKLNGRQLVELKTRLQQSARKKAGSK